MLEDHDCKTIEDLLARSGQATFASREALCLGIGLPVNNLNFLEKNSTRKDFATELVSYLKRTRNKQAILELCERLSSHFPEELDQQSLKDIQNKVRSLIERNVDVLITPPNPSENILQKSLRWIRKIFPSKDSVYIVLPTSVFITLLLMGIRYFGLLQPLELQAYDWMIRLSGGETENLDNPIVVIGITDEDIEKWGQRKISDQKLAELLNKLELDYKPKIIGLDIFLDEQVGEGKATTKAANQAYEDLLELVKKSDQIFASCQVYRTDRPIAGSKPPPGVLEDRLGYTNSITDSDAVTRRYILTQNFEPASLCQTRFSLGFQLAAQYLKETKNLNPVVTILNGKEYTKIGDTVFKDLANYPGVYISEELPQYQILIDYRDDSYFQPVSVTEFLAGKFKLKRDSIVLIGYINKLDNQEDLHQTPSGVKMPGVLIHASLVSQILDAVMHRRRLLGFWHPFNELLWIWFWSIIGGSLAWQFRSSLIVLTGGAALIILISSCFLLLVQGWWVPLVPSALAAGFTGGIVIANTLPKAPQLK